MAPSFVKTGESRDSEIYEADLGKVTVLEFELSFKQKKGNWLKDKLKPADPDLVAVAFSRGRPVDYVEPKSHKSIFDGAAENLGDAKGEGVETVRIDVGRLSHENRDIDGFVIAAACSEGFGRVAGIACHSYNLTNGPREHITVGRFDLTRPHISSGIFGAVVRVEDHWVYREFNAYGAGHDWQDIAASARAHMSP